MASEGKRKPIAQYWAAGVLVVVGILVLIAVVGPVYKAAGPRARRADIQSRIHRALTEAAQTPSPGEQAES